TELYTPTRRSCDLVFRCDRDPLPRFLRSVGPEVAVARPPGEARRQLRDRLPLTERGREPRRLASHRRDGPPEVRVRAGAGTVPLRSGEGEAVARRGRVPERLRRRGFLSLSPVFLDGGGGCHQSRGGGHQDEDPHDGARGVPEGVAVEEAEGGLFLRPRAVRQRGLADGRVRADRRIVRARRRSRRRDALQAAGAGDGPEEARGDAPPDPAAPPRPGAVRPDLGIYLAERDRAARGGPGLDEDRPVPLVGALRGRDAQEVARSGRRPRRRFERRRGRSAERVAQLARENLDGSTRAAGELQLPLAFRLEAPVAQPLAPGLDRLADRVEIERIAPELAGARPDPR